MKKQAHVPWGHSIGQRMLAVLSTVLALTLAGTALGLWSLSSIKTNTQALVDKSVSTERIASDWHRLILAGVVRTTAVAISTDNSLATFFADDTAQSSKESSELQKAVDAMLVSPAERRLFEDIGVSRKAYVTARDRVIQARREGDQSLVRKLYADEFKPASQNYLGELRRLLDAQRQDIDTASANIERINANARLGLLVFALTAIGLGATLSLWLTRSITVPIKEAAHAADAIAHFDLTTEVSGHAQDEAGRLLLSLEKMQDALLHLVEQVQQAIENVSTASQEIESGNHDLSHRTEQTAANLQQTSSAMAQLTATVRHTADSARSANALADTVAQRATQSGAVVAQVVETMAEINASSKRIEDIIGVIDTISFQTNILALNAAVEAARAGEQGRGFAVVASEVRALAQRSADAAKEIKLLISASVDRVAAGTHLVEEAGLEINDLVQGVQQVTEIIRDMSTATHAQSDGIANVGAAVAELDQMTQQNAALVEQSAAAASSMHEQAQRLSEVIGVFRLHR